jgi:hypothetical protein
MPCSIGIALHACPQGGRALPHAPILVLQPRLERHRRPWCNRRRVGRIEGRGELAKGGDGPFAYARVGMIEARENGIGVRADRGAAGTGTGREWDSQRPCAMRWRVSRRVCRWWPGAGRRAPLHGSLRSARVPRVRSPEDTV